MNLLNRIRAHFKPIDVWLAYPKKSVLKLSLSTKTFIDGKEEIEDQSPILMYQNDTTNITWNIRIQNINGVLHCWNGKHYKGIIQSSEDYASTHSMRLEFGYPAKFRKESNE